MVLQAAVLTCSLFGGLTLFACQTQIRFEFMQAGLYSALHLLIAWFFIQMLVPIDRPIFDRVYGLVGALIFCGFILVDTQLICTRLGYDDYIVAAIELYLDLINLFLKLLRLLAASRR